MTRPPLKLTIHRKREITTGITYERVTQWFINGIWCPAPEVNLAKRLTDAELAAEYWHFDMADFAYPDDDPDELTDDEWAALMKRRKEAEEALRRFATHPHYDDVS